MPPAAVLGAPFDPTNPLRPSEDTHRLFQWAHLCTGGQNEQKALLDDGWSYTTQENVHNKFYRKAWAQSLGTVTNPLLPETDRTDKFLWIGLTGAADVPRLVGEGFSYIASKHVFGGERHGHGHGQLIHLYRKRRAAAPAESDGEEPIAQQLPNPPQIVLPAPAAEPEEVPQVEDFVEVEFDPPGRRVRARADRQEDRDRHRRQDRAVLRDRAARA